MNKKLVVFAFVFVLFSVIFVVAETCENNEVEDGLRRALYLYFKSPDESLSKEELIGLTDLFVSKSEFCSADQRSALDRALGLANVPVCSDGTEYGKCSVVSPPLYCYAGRLVPRCRLCGCPGGKWCDEDYVDTAKGNQGRWGKCYSESDYTCSELDGDVCQAGEVCPGRLVDANDAETCCSEQCIVPECTNCEDCGEGLFNTCDRVECETCLEGCLYIDTLFGGECTTCLDVEVCDNSLDDDCNGIVNEGCTCEQQGGFNCSAGQACNGDLINAPDTEACCDEPCSDLVCNVCDDCGKGFFNTCDKVECESCIEDCFYVGSLFGGECRKCLDVEVCDNSLDDDCNGVINNGCTCAQQNGFICSEGQDCSGKLANASDSGACCLEECITPTCSVCSECGVGLFNTCDKTECETCLEGCYFVNGLFGGSCYSCSNTNDCWVYYDETSCQNDRCDVGNCGWNGNACVNSCSDGTLSGQCSMTKPKYCVNGTLANNCQACGCEIGQACQADGSCKSNITCGDKPDLTVTDIEITPSNPQVGQSVSRISKVKNLGSVVSPVVNIKCYVDDVQTCYGSFGPLQPGATIADYSHNVHWGGSWTAVAGTHKFRWVIDADNHASECNETNNDFIKYITVSPANLTCSDTDGGKDYYVKGLTVWKVSDGSTNQEYDYCIDGTIISEGYCLSEVDENGKIYRREGYSCPNGCKDGACISNVTNVTTCTDSDGGVDYFVKGTTISTAVWDIINGSGTYIDACQSSNYIDEYYCYNNPLMNNRVEVRHNIVPCPNNFTCQDGACVSIIQNLTCSDGTLNYQCSKTKPKYCENETLTDDCPFCGCPVGQTCQTDRTCGPSGPSCGEPVPIILNPAIQHAPAIFENKIVWQDDRNNDYDIYVYDILTKEEKRIVSAAANQINPDISGNIIVWVARWYNTQSSNIFMYDLSTGQETRLNAADTMSQTSPAIDGNRIVWTDNRNNEGTNYYIGDIYMYDISTKQEKRITTNGTTAWLPRIRGDRIVWRDHRFGSNNPEIYMYDISTGKETRITNLPQQQIDPDIYGNKIVWEDDRNGNWDIYMYDIITGQEKRVTTNVASQRNPVVYGNNIFWMDYRYSSSKPEIYKYDISTGQETRITTSSSSKGGVDVYDNKLVWWDDINGTNDIYMTTIC